MKKLKLSKEKYPWYNFYGDVPQHIDYPEGSMVDVIAETAYKYPNNYALEYYNNKITYKEMMEKIVECAKALKSMGVHENDVVSICMPNTPTALYMFYAVNMVGAIANMIHPLSSEKEIELFLNKTKSKAILTIDINPKINIGAYRKSKYSFTPLANTGNTISIIPDKICTGAFCFNKTL